jgi:hypothetical protein
MLFFLRWRFRRRRNFLDTDFTDFAGKYEGYKCFPLTELVGKMSV